MEIPFTIKSVLGGQSPLYHGAGEGQFLASVAIDPEYAISYKPSGYVLPVGYSKFSSTGVSGAPAWLMTNPVNGLLYSYNTDGELISYDNFASETVIGTPTSGNGAGGAYYNNYIYMATPTNISRYGPLNSSPAIVNTYWTAAATTGLGLTALVDTTYPGTRNVNYPNHAMHAHTDGALYFCDFDSTSTTDTTRGKGLIHKIKTKYGTAGAITNDGAGDDGSAYNVLDLALGYRPFDIESYGTDLAVIGSVLGTSTVIRQGESALFLWDTVSDSFYRQVPIASSFISAVKNVKGQLYIWGGSVDFGWQLYRYNGGYDVELLWDSHEASPPYAGAVDAFGDRVAWGAYVTTPITGACVFNYGYQNSKLGKDILHNTGVADTTGTLPVVSALKYVQQAQSVKRPIIGWRTDSAATYGISRWATGGTKNSVWRTEVFNVGKKFSISDIRIPLTGAIASGLTITPKIYFDDEASNKTLTVINSTNYTAGDMSVTYKQEEIEQAATTPLFGYANFFLEFAFTGTSDIGIALPIEITVQTYDE